MTTARIGPPGPVSVRNFGPTDERAAGPPSRRSTRPPTSGVLYFRGEPADARGFRFQRGANVQLHIDSLDAPVRVVAYNPLAILFRLENQEQLLLHEPLDAFLEHEGARFGPLRGRIERYGNRPDEHMLRIAIRDLSLPLALQMMGWLRELLKNDVAWFPSEPPQAEEHVRDTDRARKIVKALSILSGEGTIRGLGIDAEVQLGGLTDDGSAIWYHDRSLESWGDGPWAVEVMGYTSLYTLFIERARTSDGTTITPAPHLVTRTRYRFFRRATMSIPRKVRFLHPRWNEHGISEGTVVDVSYGGMCFEFDHTSIVLFPGLRIPMFTIDANEGEPIRLTGIVRSVSYNRRSDKMLCGVAVSPWCAEDEPYWIKLVAAELHRRTDTSENLLDGVWDLFDSSGYFNLAGRTVEDFAALKRKFYTVGRRAADVPHLLCQAVWPSEKGIEGSVSFLRAYETAWMGHQLAKRHGKAATPGVEPAQVLRDIYCHSFEHPQTDPDLRWIVGFVEPEVRWVQGSHLDFVRSRAATGDVLGMPVPMMSAACKDLTGIRAAGVTVAPATQYDLVTLVQHVADVRPRCYVKAYDYTPERISMERLTDLWLASGMERKRSIFFAKDGERPLAALVVESGEEGTNLFRLLDCCRIFALERDLSPEVYGMLIDEARRWFGELGRTEFLFFREEEESSYVDAAKLTLLSVPYLWIISARLVPDFLEHVCEVAGGRPRSPRRNQESK